jgi:hypothetical protein
MQVSAYETARFSDGPFNDTRRLHHSPFNSRLYTHYRTVVHELHTLADYRLSVFCSELSRRI